VRTCEADRTLHHRGPLSFVGRHALGAELPQTLPRAR
jgi:hypothetical protein